MQTKRTGRTVHAAGMAVLFAMPFLFILLSLFFGRYPLPVKEVAAALLHPRSVSDAARVAVWQLRLPRALTACLIIAAVTFVICFCGLKIGQRFGTRLSWKATILGGVILIGIGIEIFITGLFGG